MVFIEKSRAACSAVFVNVSIQRVFPAGWEYWCIGLVTLEKPACPEVKYGQRLSMALTSLAFIKRPSIPV